MKHRWAPAAHGGGKKNPIASTTTMARPEYIIEHMEEDEPDAPAHFPPWALLEYVGHGAQY